MQGTLSRRQLAFCDWVHWMAQWGFVFFAACELHGSLHGTDEINHDNMRAEYVLQDHCPIAPMSPLQLLKMGHSRPNHPWSPITLSKATNNMNQIAQVNSDQLQLDSSWTIFSASSLSTAVGGVRSPSSPPSPPLRHVDVRGRGCPLKLELTEPWQQRHFKRGPSFYTMIYIYIWHMYIVQCLKDYYTMRNYLIASESVVRPPHSRIATCKTLTLALLEDDHGWDLGIWERQIMNKLWKCRKLV